MSPMLVDYATDAVVRSMTPNDDDVRPTQWWDDFAGQSPGFDAFGDFFLGDDAPEKVPGSRTTPVKFTKGFDPETWMSKHENGRVPLQAMTVVGKEGSGATAYLRPDAAASWEAMKAEAAKDGVRLTLTDSYRTYAQQVSTYYDGGAPSATPGTSNHGYGVAVDVGEGEQREWMAQHGGRFGWDVLPSESWHFDFHGQGAKGFDPGTFKDALAKAVPTTPPKPKDGPKGQPKEYLPDPSLVPASMGMQPNLADITFNVMNDIAGEVNPKGPKVTPEFKGNSSSTKAQLYRGFMDAGKPELAKMVKTKDFETWINGEGGFDPTIVSKYYPGHGRNAGVFQFALLDRQWVWNDVDQSNWTYGATAYQQARMVVKYFNLTPEDIHNYADQIRAGTYAGWG